MPNSVGEHDRRQRLHPSFIAFLWRQTHLGKRPRCCLENDPVPCITVRKYVLHIPGEVRCPRRTHEIDRRRGDDLVAVVDESQQGVFETHRVRVPYRVSAPNLVLCRKVLEHGEHGVAHV